MSRTNKLARVALRRRWLTVLLGTSVFLNGCSAPLQHLNARQQLAIESNLQGEKAFLEGNYARALAYFDTALRIDQSIENSAGVAVNRINLARTSSAMGDSAQARAHLELLLKNPLLPYPAEQLAQAAALNATLLLSNGNLTAALDLIEQGQVWCAVSCKADPSLGLLRAQIALRSGRPDEAIGHASGVLRRLDSSLMTEEKANALRVIGEGHLQKNDPTASIARFEQALVLDREAGASHKIGLDLLYLGQASQLASRHADANAYFQRAAAVRKAAGDNAGAAAALRNIGPKQ